MKWWGWGDPGRGAHLPEGALDGLKEILDCELAANPPVAVDRLELPEPKLSPSQEAVLREVVGDRWVRMDREGRLLHASGKSYVDLVRMRMGRVDPAPDAVVYPADHDQVQELLARCSSDRVAVVPFGGGTSVVGGVEPLRDGFQAVIALDLSRMKQVVSIDGKSLTATLGPGLCGPEVESSLRAQGLTLGHFPQSYEYSTLGGWIATRSAGQASTGYGKIEKMVVGLRFAAPIGEMAARPLPATAAGPQLRELVVGSEGVLGVITEATMCVRRTPESRHYEGWMFKSFPEGVDALRTLEQDGPAPDLARLSDEVETQVTMLMAGVGGITRRLAGGYLRLRGCAGGCIAILGFEGTSDEVRHRGKAAARTMRRSGAVYLGTAPGKKWLKSRFDGPYLRDELLSNSIMVETLETATEWSNLISLYRATAGAISGALEGRGRPSLVMCHTSHLYPSGASLYFTFLSPQEKGMEVQQWRAAKDAASDAIVSGGGTITHHHAVGRDHMPWIADEIGDSGVDLLRATKTTLDPQGIMNPGKLIPKADPSE